VIDFESIVRFLEETDYRGWIMTEDESPDAVNDSDGVVMADGKYMGKIGGF
jgi:inosose dehydratase